MHGDLGFALMCSMPTFTKAMQGPASVEWNVEENAKFNANYPQRDWTVSSKAPDVPQIVPPDHPPQGPCLHENRLADAEEVFFSMQIPKRVDCLGRGRGGLQSPHPTTPTFPRT